jgi:CRISPR-associated protein Cas1
VPGQNIADVTKDPIGLISGNPADEEHLDIPAQKMTDGQPDTIPTGKYPVKLNDDAFRKVIDAFEKKLTTSFYYPPAEKHLTYGDALIYQAGHFRKVIEGEVKTYQPVLLR